MLLCSRVCATSWLCLELGGPSSQPGPCTRISHPGGMWPTQREWLSATGHGCMGTAQPTQGAATCLSRSQEPSVLPRAPRAFSDHHKAAISMQRSWSLVARKLQHAEETGVAEPPPHAAPCPPSALDAKHPQRWPLVLCVAQHRMLLQACNTHPLGAHSCHPGGVF